MSNKGWIVFGVIVAGFMGLMIYLSDSNKIDLTGVDSAKIIGASEENGNTEDHVYGNKDSKVVLIEYADYQCPGCASMSKKMKTISEDYKDQIAFVFRNYVSDGHANALSAAAATESANLQGKFWEMSQTIFNNQAEWARASTTERDNLYKKYASEIGLDEEKFIEGMKSATVRKKIEFDKAIAKKLELKATPSFVLNGEVIDYSVWSDTDKLRETINNKLKENNISLPESQK